MKRISEKVYRECETLDDLIMKMGRIRDGYVVSDVGDMNTFKSRLESFKEVIKEKLPEFTIEEILKFDEYFYELKSLYKWYGVNRLFAALEFEKRTKNEKNL